MKLTKKRDYLGTIRKVWNDDKTECFGVIGTVEDLLKENILEYCDAPAGTWAFLSRDEAKIKSYFSDTRDGVLSELKK